MDEIVNLFFIIYLFFLFEIVSGQDVTYQSYSGLNIVPFSEIFKYDIKSSIFIKNIVGNIILFIPYGVFASHYTRATRIKHIILLALLLSASIETTQLFIGRVFDVDDIILNVLGAAIGYILYKPFLYFRRDK